MNVPAPAWVTSLIWEPLMEMPLVWFLVSITIAAAVYAWVFRQQRERMRRASQTLAAQLHCRCKLCTLEDDTYYGAPIASRAHINPPTHKPLASYTLPSP